MNSATSLRLAIQRQTEEALNLVRLAVIAHRDRLPGLEQLYTGAERAYELILADI
jgi:hypothetical protein